MTHHARNPRVVRRYGRPLVSDDGAAVAPPPATQDAFALAARWKYLTLAGDTRNAAACLDQLRELARRPPLWKEGEESRFGLARGEDQRTAGR